MLAVITKYVDQINGMIMVNVAQETDFLNTRPTLRLFKCCKYMNYGLEKQLSYIHGDLIRPRPENCT